MWAMSRALLCGKNIHSSYKCLIWFQWLQITNKNFKSKVCLIFPKIRQNEHSQKKSFNQNTSSIVWQ